MKEQARVYSGGAACLAKYGLDHYRRLSAMARLAPRPRRSIRETYSMGYDPDVMAAIREIGEERGLCRAEVIRMALRELLRIWGRL